MREHRVDERTGTDKRWGGRSGGDDAGTGFGLLASGAGGTPAGPECAAGEAAAATVRATSGWARDAVPVDGRGQPVAGWLSGLDASALTPCAPPAPEGSRCRATVRHTPGSEAGPRVAADSVRR